MDPLELVSYVLYLEKQTSLSNTKISQEGAFQILHIFQACQTLPTPCGISFSVKMYEVKFYTIYLNRKCNIHMIITFHWYIWNPHIRA